MNITSATAPILAVHNLGVVFETEMGPVSAIEDMSFELRRGETLAIVGESGSGKTTAMNAVLGLLAGNGRVTSGEILFQGQDLTAISEKQFQRLRGAAIGLVPQDPMSSLNPVLTIGQQLTETLLVHQKATKRTVKAAAIAALEHAGLPEAESRLRQYPHELSGGMRQRVLIGIGLACEPTLLIADEPTSALDVTVQRQILDNLATFTRELGTSVILITHDLGLAAERCERIIVMSKGQLVEEGEAAQILSDPQHEYTQRLVQAAPSIAMRRGDAKAHAEHRSGSEISLTPGDAPAAAPLLRVKQLRKTFAQRGGRGLRRQRFAAVDNVSFDIGAAETVAIVGESGSGKSTTARLILRLEEPDSGSIEFTGTNIASLSGAELKRARKRLQPIFQDPYSSINPMSSIEQVLIEPLQVHRVGTTKERKDRARELLDMVALPASFLDRYPAELSGGQRQRVAIARAIALHPELIICDEPVSALDVLVQAQVLDLLEDLQRDLGLSYLFISHDLAVVRMISDNVLVMRNGEVVERGDSETLFAHPQHEYTRQLLMSIPGNVTTYPAA